MKKLMLILIPIVFGLGVFVVCSNSLKNEEKYGYYVQELYYKSDEHILEGKQKVGFYNYTDNVLSELKLHLYPNAYREGAKASVVSVANYEKAYPNGKDYGFIAIESVSGENLLEFEVGGADENVLIVELEKEVYPQEMVEFEVGFSVKLANINHRLGYGDSTINLCNYYPIMCVYENGEFVTDVYDSNGDPFYSKVANYDVSISYDKDLTLASSGVMEINKDGEFNVAKIKSNKVRDFAMVLSENFSVCKDSYKGIEINYYHYGDYNVAQSVNVVKEVLELNEQYGKYPYPQISVVEADFVHGGMEYPGLVLIADNLIDYETYINVVVHELCHQWWYGVVGNNQYLYGFLDEGLTDYSTALFYEKYPKYNLSKAEIFKNASNSYSFFVKVYEDVVPDFSTKMIRPLNEYATENEYVYLSYVKGMLMFGSLDEMLGQKNMVRCLKHFYESYKFKEATADDLIDCFCKASGRNLKGFFDAWLNGKEITIDFNDI